MTTVKVIINADGKTCTTVNPYGKTKPIFVTRYKRDLWDKAESERKTYEIDFRTKYNSGKSGELYEAKLISPGTEHKAEIVNGKAVIL